MRIFIVRKKWLWIISSMIVILASILLFTYYHRSMGASQTITLNKVIIVDAGHGGVDGGTSGRSGVKESEINLLIALKLRLLLEQNGAIVLLTRDDDMGLYSDTGRIRDKKNEDLKNRIDIVNNSQADLYVSIHLNSFPQTQYYGAQTFYPQGSEDSKRAAEYVQEELIRVLNNGNDRVTKVKNDTYLMKHTKIPTVLVECGFLSNPMEERLLQESQYQEQVAWSIYIGILRYFHESKAVVTAVDSLN